MTYSTVLFKTNKDLKKNLAELEPVELSEQQFLAEDWSTQVLITSVEVLNQSSYVEKIYQAQINKKLNRLVLTQNADITEPLNLESYNKLKPELYKFVSDLTTDNVLQILENLQKEQQDETYLILASELNTQYEQLKEELQSTLQQKNKQLEESQRHISEISQRFELLRKALFLLSNSKDLKTLEADLNDLLVKQQRASHFKIMKADEAIDFEKTLKQKTFKSFQIKISEDSYLIFFVRDDKRNFRKSDLELFQKLSEAVEINLSRAIKIRNLTRNERLFDLAFHSSPQFITVIDSNYNIVQANLAVEKIISEDETNSKCYSILFKRNAPCVGCQRGSQFQVHQDNKTFRVQSKSYQSAEETDQSLWVNLYEDISEQIVLESKFQQAARLAELGLISSSIAHELNNPLGGIISYLQIMKLELPQNHPFQNDLNLMNETAQRMKKIIEDLLIFSRKEDIPTKEMSSLEDLLQKNIDMLQVQLKKDNLNIVLSDEVRRAKILLSPLHFRSSIHLVLQYLIQRQKIKKQNHPPFVGLVEVKFFQGEKDQSLIFYSNTGPVEVSANTKDLTLMALEKTLLDQGFQARLIDDRPGWIRVEIHFPF